MKGYIHSIQSLGGVDGPGVRCVVFFQGCYLRCKFCHNPDTWDINKAKLMLTPKELVEKILRYESYFSSNGGVTFSGGEPLVQLDFLNECCTLLKERGVHVCIDTSGVGNIKEKDYHKKLSTLLDNVDLVLLDIKHYEPNKYRQITGQSIEAFNEFLEVLQKKQTKIWIRQVITPTLTDNVLYIEGLKNYLSTIKNVEKIELLPYHTMGLEKYQALNIDYPLKGIVPPTEKEFEKYQEIIQKEN